MYFRNFNIYSSSLFFFKLVPLRYSDAILSQILNFTNCPNNTELFYNSDNNTFANDNMQLESFATENTENTKVPLKKSNSSFFSLNSGVITSINAKMELLRIGSLMYFFISVFNKLSDEDCLNSYIKNSKNLSLSISLTQYNISNAFGLLF